MEGCFIIIPTWIRYWSNRSSRDSRRQERTLHSRSERPTEMSFWTSWYSCWKDVLCLTKGSLGRSNYNEIREWIEKENSLYSVIGEYDRVHESYEYLWILSYIPYMRPLQPYNGYAHLNHPHSALRNALRTQRGQHHASQRFGEYEEPTWHSLDQLSMFPLYS